MKAYKVVAIHNNNTLSASIGTNMLTYFLECRKKHRKYYPWGEKPTPSMKIPVAYSVGKWVRASKLAVNKGLFVFLSRERALRYANQRRRCVVYLCEVDRAIDAEEGYKTNPLLPQPSDYVVEGSYLATAVKLIEKVS